MRLQECKTCAVSEVRPRDVGRCALQSVVRAVQAAVRGRRDGWTDVLVHGDGVLYIALVSYALFLVVQSAHRRRDYVRL